MEKVIVILTAVFMFTACATKNKARQVSAVLSESSLISNIRSNEANIVPEPRHMTQFYGSSTKAARSVLIMHGLHESPAYMQGLSKFYHALGYNVISLRLSGHHTTDRESLNKVQYSEWIKDAEIGFAAAEELGSHVEVAGYSTGGTLAMYLALKYPAKVKKLTMIAPALALNDKVFISGLLLGQTNLDGRKICKTEGQRDGFLCRTLKASDQQIAPMLAEGLLPSPAAGFQVQGLIDFITDQFLGPRLQAEGLNSDQDYYQRLSRMYGKLSVPLVMINSEADDVVNWKFNERFAQSYKTAASSNLLISANKKISHLAVCKSVDDRFRKNPELINTSFAEITEAILRVP